MHFEIFQSGPIWDAFQNFPKWSYMGCISKFSKMVLYGMLIYFHILKFEILPPKMGPYGINSFWTDPYSIYFWVSKFDFIFQNRLIWDAYLFSHLKIWNFVTQNGCIWDKCFLDRPKQYLFFGVKIWFSSPK